MNYFECKYCFKKLIRESSFDKHNCDSMKRHKLSRSVRGAKAFADYSTWLKIRGFKNHGREHFIDSKYFVSFMGFAQFASKVALPNRQRFIEFMVEVEVLPKDWKTLTVYEHFMERYEVIVSPNDQVIETISTLRELARIFECDVNDVFVHLDPMTFLQIVQAKKMSPWFLLFSTIFHGYVQSELSREQRVILNTHINADCWRKVFEKHPKKVVEMKGYVKVMGL